jgi:hypothetical protein
MSGNIACIAAVLLGIDAGWQPLPEGGVEYIIQIEPQLLETLKSGEPIQSDVPSYVKDVRAYRIVVGTAELPRQLPPGEVDSPAAPTAGRNLPPTDPFLPPPVSPTKWPDLSGSLPPLRQPGAAPPATPNLFEPTPDSKRIDAQQAGYLQQSAAAPQGESKSPSEQQSEREESQPEATAKPWTPLIVALFTLFGSLGANFYLGWITWNTRSRYRSLVEARAHAELV